MDKKYCQQCRKEFFVKRYRRAVAKYCSNECVGKANKKAPNTKCVNCLKPLLIKPSRLKKMKWGAHCSTKCLGETKSKRYAAENNPNYKGIREDSDGYSYTWSDGANLNLNSTDEKKLHRAICAESLGVKKIPVGLHVHHRDCNTKNNSIDNLSVMTASDHKWLHKQFGNAALWAYMNKKIDIESLCDWSNSASKARRLLELRVELQSLEDFN